MPFTGQGTGIQNASDIFFSSVTNGQVLRYNGATSKWNNVAQTVAAGDITSGVVAPARLGSGTADSTTYLRGDGTWATPAGAASTIIDAADHGILPNTGDVTAALNTLIDTYKWVLNSSEGVIIQLGRGVYETTGIILRSGVTLQGMGWAATEVRFADGANGDAVIKCYTSSNGVEPNTFKAGVRDLFINGNYWGQTSGTGYGFMSVMNPLWSKASNDYEFDSQHILQNVLIRYTRGTGYYADGRGEHFLHNVVVRDSRSHAFEPTADTHMVACVAGGNIGHGFYLHQASVRMTSCKAFYNGYEWTEALGEVWTDKHGFFIENVTGGSVIMAGCEAQDNGGSGITITNSHGHNIQANCDSNSRAAATPAGVDLWEARANIIDVVSVDRYNPVTQTHALRIRSNSVGNQIRLAHRGNLAAVGTALSADSVTTDNDITAMVVSGTTVTTTRVTA